MDTLSKERQLFLAIQAIQKDSNLSVRAAAKIYSVPRSTLGTRLQGTTPRRDTMSKSQKLTKLEELTIVEHILNLDSRSFPPRLSGVEDMTNRLLAERDAPKVRKC